MRIVHSMAVAGIVLLAGCDRKAHMQQEEDGADSMEGQSGVRALLTSKINDLKQVIKVDSSIDIGQKKIIFVSNIATDSDATSERDFSIVLGSLNTTNGSLCDATSNDCMSGEGRINSSDPAEGTTPEAEWHASHGYALVRGWRPRARTNRATAAAEGTVFFVQVDESGGDEIHRFVLIEGGPLYIHRREDGKNEWDDSDHAEKITNEKAYRTIDMPNYYVEVTKNEAGVIEVTEPAHLDDQPNQSLKELIKLINESEFNSTFKSEEPAPAPSPASTSHR